MATQQVGGVTIEVGLNPNTSKYEFNTTWPSGKTGTISADTLKNLNNPLYLAARRSEFIATLTDPADIAAATTFYRDLPVVIPVMEQQFAYEQAAMTEQDTIVTDPVNNADQAKNLNNQYDNAGGSDDDSGGNNNTTGIDTTASPTGNAENNYPLTVQPTSGNAGTTTAGKAGTSVSQQSNSKYGQFEDLPGRRPYNPLSEFSSYTYQLSLYMLTPEALNLYISSGYAQRNEGSGWYLICQSGGINNSPAANQAKRAPGIDLDFYMDDLEFTTTVSAAAAASPVKGHANFKFKVYEPYGISFTRKLTNAARTVQSLSSFPNVKNNPNALKQCYVLGIRFYGYDRNGNLMKATDFPNPDPNRTDDNAVFERFFAISIKSMNFKLDGKTVVYHIEAVNTSIQESLGVIRGTIPVGMSVIAGTLKEALQGKETTETLTYEQMKTALDKKTGVQSLMGFLNQYEAERTVEDPKTKVPTKKEMPNHYVIEFQKDLFDNIAFTDPREFDNSKIKVPMSTAQNPTNSTVKTEKNATVNKTQRTYEIASGASIVSVIDQFISNSSYIKRSLKQLASELPEPKPINNPNPHQLSWFSILPEVQIIGYDLKLNDYQYEIKYKIAEYKIPYLRTSYAKYTSTYPGPHKLYNYWFTGKNSEIIKYEQQYNSLYYLTATGEKDERSGLPIPQMIGPPGDGSITGQQNKASEIVNSVKEDIFSPGDITRAKISILGDPDYISQLAGIDINTISQKIYGKDGYSINPVGGQVFIEIFFQTATDYTHTGAGDYSATYSGTTQPGLLDVSDSIQFYAYPGSTDNKMKGITYQVQYVNHKFSRGAFTQELDLVLANLNKFNTKNQASSETDARLETEQMAGVDSTRISADYIKNTRVSRPSTFGDLNSTLQGTNLNTSNNSITGGSSTITTESGKVVQDDDAWEAQSFVYNTSDNETGREEE